MIRILFQPGLPCRPHLHLHTHSGSPRQCLPHLPRGTRKSLVRQPPRKPRRQHWKGSADRLSRTNLHLVCFRSSRRSAPPAVVRRSNYGADERERASSFAMIVTTHRGALPDRSSFTDRTRPKIVDPLTFSAVGNPLYWARRQRRASLESLISNVCTEHLD